MSAFREAFSRVPQRDDQELSGTVGQRWLPDDDGHGTRLRYASPHATDGRIRQTGRKVTSTAVAQSSGSSGRPKNRATASVARGRPETSRPPPARSAVSRGPQLLLIG